MTLALLGASLILAFLLLLTTFVQLLYLESTRLHSRDLPSLTFFEESLESRLGMAAERGTLAFAVIKHTLLLVLSAAFFVGYYRPELPVWRTFLEALGSSWLIMVVTTYAAPHILYRRTSGQWLVPFVPILRVLALVIKPVVVLLEFLESLASLAEERPAEEAATQAENIEALIEAGAEEGLIEEDDRKLIQSVVEFGDKVVREVMTPRPNIVAIAANAPLEQLRQLVINEQYSRIPVYEDTIDQIIGFVHVRDMFELEEDERATRSVRELMRPMKLVPETKPVNDLMREMQQDSTHMVVVVDEYGNTAGLATMEDLVEVILGEIRDEHEPDADIKEDGQGNYIVSGSFDLARLSDLVEFRPEEDIESTTVGGLVSEWLGHVPRPGEVVERNGIRIEVLASDDLRVEQVRIGKSQAVAHE